MFVAVEWLILLLVIKTLLSIMRTSTRVQTLPSVGLRTQHAGGGGGCGGGGGLLIVC